MLQFGMIPDQPALTLDGGDRSLVIADLHIGFEGGFAANSVFLGKSTSTGELTSSVVSLIREHAIDNLILLGDVKSTIRSISSSEWRDVPLFLEEVCRAADVILVPGNHDAGIDRLVPSQVTLTAPAGLILEDTLLTHGHAVPPGSLSYVNRIVMGHIHPTFFSRSSVVNGQYVWVYLRAAKERIFPDRPGDIEITVVPSFNRYLFATHRNSRRRSISPIIQRVRDTSSAKIVTLNGTIIGNESALGQVL